MAKSTPIYLRSKLAATVGADGVLRKNFDASRHMLRKPKAIAWEAAIIDQALAAGAHAIEVTDRETGDKYKMTMPEFRRLCFTVDRGFGRQLAVELRHWTKNGAHEPVQLAFQV